MADNKIIITSTDTSGQTVQKTLTDINPDASNEQLATFGQMLNDLTTNNYGKTERVIKVDCDAEAGGGGKLTPVLQYQDTSGNPVSSRSESPSGSGWGQIYYTGDGAVGYAISPNTPYNGVQIGAFDQSTHIAPATLGGGGAALGQYTITFFAFETDNYKAATYDVALTVR